MKRMVEFGDGLDEELFLVFGAGEERDVATRFVAGGDGNGRLAVQRALPLADVARPALASMLEVLTGERDDEDEAGGYGEAALAGACAPGAGAPP